MRAVVQRVGHAEVTVGSEIIASIGQGMLVLVGAVDTDTAEDVATLAAKLATMRIFPDDAGKMNLSVTDTGGSVLVVSQFTLLADITRGRRPSFTAAAHPDHARWLIDDLASRLAGSGIPVESGEFGASMEVSLTNCGPVTFVVDIAEGRVL